MVYYVGISLHKYSLVQNLGGKYEKDSECIVGSTNGLFDPGL